MNRFILPLYSYLSSGACLPIPQFLPLTKHTGHSSAYFYLPVYFIRKDRTFSQEQKKFTMIYISRFENRCEQSGYRIHTETLIYSSDKKFKGCYFFNTKPSLKEHFVIRLNKFLNHLKQVCSFYFT